MTAWLQRAGPFPLLLDSCSVTNSFGVVQMLKSQHNNSSQSLPRHTLDPSEVYKSMTYVSCPISLQ